MKSHAYEVTLRVIIALFVLMLAAGYLLPRMDLVSPYVGQLLIWGAFSFFGVLFPGLYLIGLMREDPRRRDTRDF